MCFFNKKPKLKDPKTQTAPITTAPPIESQTPKVVSGAESADAERSRKRKANPTPLSLFQIQLVPGAGGLFDDPGAQVNG